VPCALQLFRKPHPARGPAVVTKLERLRLANPQYHATVQQPGYLHAHVKRMVLADRSSVVAISCVGQKVFTISANFTVAVHWWQPYQSDDYVERKADGSSKRVHLPFTHALAALERVEKQSLVTGQHVLFSYDGKLLFEVNNWDDSLRVYAVQSAINTEQLKLGLKDRSAAFGSLTCTLMQHLRQHKGRITCISLGRDERTLVTGSSDCTLLVWQLEYEEAANKIAGLLQEGKTYVKGEPRHRLRGHEDEVVAVAVQSELDVCVSVSARGLVLLHSLMKGWFLLRIRVPTAHELRAAAIAAATAAASSTPSEQIAAEELLRGPGSVDQPLAVDYGLDEYGKDSIAGMRRQAASISSPRSAYMQSSEPDFLSSPPSASSSSSPPPSSLLHLPSLVRFTVEGNMVFFSRSWDQEAQRFVHSQLSVCGVNGRNWRVVLVDEDVSCLTVNADGKLLAVGGARGSVCIRRLHDLKIIQRFEPCASAVAAIAFSSEQEYLFVSTVQGELSVLVVHC
jgi:WD40 repeat protein